LVATLRLVFNEVNDATYGYAGLALTLLFRNIKS